MAFLGRTPNVSKPTLLSPDPLLIHGEHLPIFDLFWETKNIRYFTDTAHCRAAPGHLIFLRVGIPVNGNFQLRDSITSCQCGLEMKEVALLFLFQSLPWYFCSHQINKGNLGYPTLKFAFQFYLPVYLILIIWGLEQNSYFNIQLHMVSRHKTCLFVFSLNRAFLGYQCLAKFLKVGPDVQRKWSSFITPLTDLAFLASWILGKGTTT